MSFFTEQAKRSVQLWMELMDQNFATKADFKEHYFMTSADLKHFHQEMKTAHNELKNEIKELRIELKNEFKTDMKDLLRHRPNMIQ